MQATLTESSSQYTSRLIAINQNCAAQSACLASGRFIGRSRFLETAWTTRATRDDYRPCADGRGDLCERYQVLVGFVRQFIHRSHRHCQPSKSTFNATCPPLVNGAPGASGRGCLSAHLSCQLQRKKPVRRLYDTETSIFKSTVRHLTFTQRNNTKDLAPITANASCLARQSRQGAYRASS